MELNKQKYRKLQPVGISDRFNEKATREFEDYRRKEMLQYESDFDRAIRVEIPGRR